MSTQTGDTLMISLVVATKDRPDELAKFVRSLSNSSLPPREIILVDQSEAENRVKNQKLISQVDFCSKKYLHDEGTGLSRARNIGILEVSGDIVAFPDDDCWYPSDLIERVVDFFRATPCDFLCGSFREETLVNEDHPPNPRMLSFMRSNTDGICSVGLFINIKRITPTQINFDERIGAGTIMPAGEEIDLVLRLLRMRFIGKYDPSYFAYHLLNSNTLSNTLEDREFFLRRLKGRAYIRTKNIILPLVFIKLVGSIFVDLPFLLTEDRRVSLKYKVDGVLASVKAHSKTKLYSLFKSR